MAGESQIVERLAKASTRDKALILTAVLGVLGAVYYFMFYQELLEDREKLVVVRKRQIEEEQRLIARQSELVKLRKQRDEVEARLKANAITLPRESELPAFHQDLETQAVTANVRIVSHATDKDVPIESYVKVPVKMEITGDFYQINNYFKLLYDTKRIITVENLHIGEPKREPNRVLLTARFTAATFRQASKPGQPTAPESTGTPAAPAGAPTAPAAAPAGGGASVAAPPGGAPAAAPGASAAATPAVAPGVATTPTSLPAPAPSAHAATQPSTTPPAVPIPKPLEEKK